MQNIYKSTYQTDTSFRNYIYRILFSQRRYDIYPIYINVLLSRLSNKESEFEIYMYIYLNHSDTYLLNKYIHLKKLLLIINLGVYKKYYKLLIIIYIHLYKVVTGIFFFKYIFK